MNCIFWPWTWFESGNVYQDRRVFSILHYTGQQFIQYIAGKLTGFNNSSNISLANSLRSTIEKPKTIACVTKLVIIRRHMLLFVSIDDKKMATQGVNLPLHWLFLPSSRRHYCTSKSVTWTAVSLLDSIYELTLYILLGSIVGNQKYAVYPLYSPCVSYAVLTTRGEPVKAGLRKEMSGKNGGVITKK